MSALIDTLMPSWDVHEPHGVDFAAPPERTWAALQQVTVGELRLTRLLMAARGLGRPWQLRPARGPISGAEDFTGFDEPGWVRMATDFRVVATAAGSRLSTETRIQGTDAGARRRFARYWRIVGTGSALIRRDVLQGARRRAERG